MKLDILDALVDDDLRMVDARCLELLKQHDTQRKDKAMAEARTLLASVGLSLKDLVRKTPAPKAKGPVYHSGRTYQHPVNKGLIWPGKGKKPGWLIALETEGGTAIEIERDVVGSKKDR